MQESTNQALARSRTSGMKWVSGQFWLQKHVSRQRAIDHFTVVCIVAWPLNENETGVELVLIETSLLFLC